MLEHCILYDMTSGTYSLLERGWPGSKEVIKGLRTLRLHSGSLRYFYEEKESFEHVAALLPSSGFILVAWDCIDANMATDFPDEQIREVLYDKSVDQWYDLPTLKCGDSYTLLGVLDSALMCDLRWDAVP